MWKFILVALANLLSCLVIGQTNGFQGKWIGYLTQPNGIWTDTFWFNMELQEYLSNEFQGVSRIGVRGTDFYGVMSLTATATNEGLKFQEIQISNQNRPTTVENGRWCIKNGVLKLSNNGNELFGPWTAEYGCPPGNIHVFRFATQQDEITSNNNEPQFEMQKEVSGRLVEIQKTIKVKETKANLAIWDDRLFDHDSVSLSVNGEWLIQQFEVTKGKKSVPITLLKGRPNYIVLFAHNVGDVPPNTVAMILSAGEKEWRLNLSSDLNSCGTLKVDVE